jgi:hypothetical protein
VSLPPDPLPIGPSEHVTRFRPSSVDRDQSWWQRYSKSLEQSFLSPTGHEVLEADSSFITQRGVLGAGSAGDSRWPISRVRKGLVLGAVQSGKTASMLGVAAQSIDAGIDMVVVLAGTRTSLWRQTTERLVRQLDRFDPAAATERAAQRLLVPDPLLDLDGEASPSLSELYSVNGPKFRRTLTSGRPTIAVVMKNVHHLRAMANVIRDRVIPAVERNGRPFHLLVLDDEADDGSILDARVEANLDPALHDLKQIPRAIVDLWETRPHTGQTSSPHIFATYIGYTATPQANFLQSDHNPLTPTDFVFALRTPWDRGALEPRSATYQEPRGLASFYSGGETFYTRLPNPALFCQTTSAPTEDLEDAVRAFLVAGAIRAWRAKDRGDTSGIRARHFASRAEAIEHSPTLHSMLLHPSSIIDDHFAAAADLLEVACGMGQEEAADYLADGHRSLPAERVERELLAKEAAWSGWLHRYRSSAAEVQDAFGLHQPRRVPADSDWPEIRRILLSEVVPLTQLKIVNSDPDADDRPQFEPIEVAPGEWSAAPDLSTIFIAGNVMTRGLTLEGLTTTMFLRTSNNPLADTQTQMQRWFGYRGGDLELCRVFMSTDQLGLFRRYHDADEALRRAVVSHMNDEGEDAAKHFVLAGLDFSATGKLTNVSNVPLCPGATPFVRLVNDGTATDSNVDLLAETFRDAPSEDLAVNGLRGRILVEPLRLTAAADLLDRLTFENYRPSVDGWEGERWQDLERKMSLDHDETEELTPFFRPPATGAAEPSPYARGGPYAIAAYLRLWSACLTRHTPGLVATDDAQTPWSLVNLSQKTAQQPQFYVGIRYGSGEPVVSGSLSKLPFTIRPMRRAVSEDRSELAAGWGSRNPDADEDDYFGDELFDYHLHKSPRPYVGPGQPVWRPPGAPGLILFHVVEIPDRPHPVVTVGTAMPLGGPDQFAARKPATPPSGRS